MNLIEDHPLLMWLKDRALFLYKFRPRSELCPSMRMLAVEDQLNYYKYRNEYDNKVLSRGCT